MQYEKFIHRTVNVVDPFHILSLTPQGLSSGDNNSIINVMLNLMDDELTFLPDIQFFKEPNAKFNDFFRVPICK